MREISSGHPKLDVKSLACPNPAPVADGVRTCFLPTRAKRVNLLSLSSRMSFSYFCITPLVIKLPRTRVELALSPNLPCDPYHVFPVSITSLFSPTPATLFHPSRLYRLKTLRLRRFMSVAIFCLSLSVLSRSLVYPLWNDATS